MLDGPYDQLPMPGIDPLHGQRFLVRKRDGRLDEFNEARICLAIEGAFKAAAGLGRDERLPDETQSAVKICADSVSARVLGRAIKGEELEVEKIQDAVEEQLMLAGHVEAARRYILYREERRQTRALREQRLVYSPPHVISRQDQVAEILHRQAASFSLSINEGQFLKWLAPEMLDYDLEALAHHLRPARDELLLPAARQQLREDYALKDGDRVLEGPQGFWMRMAMGLALNEGGQAQTRALEFYEVLSTLRFLPSDAILRRAGSALPQLALCQAAAGAGAVEQVRAASGSCVWLEPWHAGVFDFLTPSQNGQTFRRGLWIPDLFLRRVQEKDHWTLFDPAETPGLPGLHGAAFEELYLRYEQQARDGQLEFSRVVEADDLWRRIMESVRDDGQTIVGFKDAVNMRGPFRPPGGARHGGFGDGFLGAAPGVLGAINLPAFLTGDAASPLDLPLLRDTVITVVRMLDNALDLSAYPSPAARASALANRVIGLGMHGFADALDRLRGHDAGADAAEFADRSAEALAWCGVWASAALAAERGPCAGFSNSKWSEGLMPLDTLTELDRQRAFGLSLDRSSLMDWNIVRQAVSRHGMRHTSVTACVADPAAVLAGLHASVQPSSYEIETPRSLIECAARRQKWIDMSQPFSFPSSDVAIEDLSQWYLLAWQKGLKTVSPLVPHSRDNAVVLTRSSVAHEAFSIGLTQKS